MLCNALDKDDSTEINVSVTTEIEFNVVMVSDNGSKKLSKEDLTQILDFDNKASSKRGILRVSRGYLGNALKCIFGFSYALTEDKKLPIQSIILESGSYRFTVTLKPNLVTEIIEKDIQTTGRQDNGLTSFLVKFPKQEDLETKELEDVVIATSMVNPSREIRYSILGKQGVQGHAESNPIRRDTSVLWYKQEEFEKLFKEYVRATPNTPIKEFISIFRGFTGKPIIREILQEIGVNHDDSTIKKKLQFFPTTPLKDIRPLSVVQKLYAVMKAKSKPIENRSIPFVLGMVGKESFENLTKENGWSLHLYEDRTGTKLDCDTDNHETECKDISHVEYPWLIEFVIIDRPEDNEGLKVYQCVNFMASMEDIFSKFAPIKYRLGLMSIKEDTPVTVIAHLVCPVLKWLNYGKSGLNE